MSNGNSINVTYDDFDPIISYSDLTQWTSPNPQDNPTWYRESEDVTKLPWHEATLHYTTVKGAELSLNFTTSQIWIYGALNASSPSYTINLDGQSTDETPSTVAEGRALLYSSTELSNAPHRMTITNQGDGLGIDLVVLGFDLGSDLQNHTLDDAGDGVSYTGTWTNQNRDSFNGTSTYTKGPNNAVEFSFAGSGAWIYGDTVADHGDFSVYINGSTTPFGTWNARTPCGGDTDYGKKCEKWGTLKAFVGPLPQGQHVISVVNGGPTGDNATFFDFDYVEYTTPSTYPQFTINGTCAQGSCGTEGGNGSTSSTGTGSDTGSTTGSGSGSGTASASAASGSPTAASSGALPVANAGLGGMVLGVLGLWTLKKMGFNRW